MYRALVVDDEEIIRNGICKKLARFFPGLETAPAQENAIEALHYIQNHPVDIVFVDIKMPMVDGLEFIQRAKQYNQNLLFVVISGYKSFDYARTALTLGIRDYLLKPIDNDEFKKIVSQLIDELDQRKKSREQHSDMKAKAYEGTFLKRGRYLSKLVSVDADLDTEELRDDLKKLGIVFRDTHYLVLSVDAVNINSLEEFKDVSGLAILQYAVCNVIDEVFSNCGCSSFVKDKTDSQFVIILNTDTPLASYFVLEKANKLAALLHNIYGLRLVVGIGRPAGAAGDLCKSYQQALRAMMECGMNGDRQVFISDDIQTSSEVRLIPGFQRDLLESYIRNKNEEAIRNSLHEIFMEFGQSGYDNFRIIGYDIYFIIVKLLRENDKDTEIGYTMFEQLGRIIASNRDLGYIEEWFAGQLIEVSKMFERGKRSYGKTVVEEIKDYVETNYSKDISLGSIAARFYINTSYLSQIFKKEMNIKFIDYITNIRLGKAKELLLETDLSVNEVAEAIGYSDTRYFREVFVRYMKETPAQFRKNSQ